MLLLLLLLAGAEIGVCCDCGCIGDFVSVDLGLARVTDQGFWALELCIVVSFVLNIVG